MKPKILLSALIIIVAIGGTFVATRAYFQATGTAAGSKITAGTLDMTVGGAQGSALENFIADNIGNVGDVTGSKTWAVKNTGTLPGRLYFRIQDVVNGENGCNQPESLVDTTCDDPGSGQGELGKALKFNVYLDGVLVTSTNLDTVNQDAVKTAWNALPKVMVPAGTTKQVKIEYLAGENNYGNEVQGDSISFNTRFDLVQDTTAATSP
jgi:hypothetical protein